MRETTRHRKAFDRYWRLGPNRTLERLHAVLDAEGKAPALRTLEEWSRLLHWQHRIDDLERGARDAEDEARIAAIREMEERQAREALLLQQKGTEWIAPLSAGDASPEAAIRAIVEGARLERLVRGEVTERTELQVGADPRLEGYSDEELQRIVEIAERDLGGTEQA